MAIKVEILYERPSLYVQWFNFSSYTDVTKLMGELSGQYKIQISKESSPDGLKMTSKLVFATQEDFDEITANPLLVGMWADRDQYCQERNITMTRTVTNI